MNPTAKAAAKMRFYPESSMDIFILTNGIDLDRDGLSKILTKSELGLLNKSFSVAFVVVSSRHDYFHFHQPSEYRIHQIVTLDSLLN